MLTLSRSSGRWWFVFAVVAVCAPLDHVHERTLGQVRNHLLRVNRVRNGLETPFSELEKLSLICVLPEQFAYRHFRLVDFPDRKPKRQEPHKEDDQRFPIEVPDVELVERLLEKQQRHGSKESSEKQVFLYGFKALVFAVQLVMLA